MSRDLKPVVPPATTRRGSEVQLASDGDAGLLTIAGLVDERFAGFGDVGAIKTLVIDVSGIERMTSFGVRQWLRGMDALPKSLTDIYLFGCPTFFVDQLNMVLNFAGTCKVLTVLAPYTCPSCGVESSETIDVLALRSTLAKDPPEKTCSKCGGKLQFDEMPESYFAFATKCGALSLQPAAARILATRGLYASSDTASEKPPKVIKLIHGSVTYFHIVGTIGALFRARPFLVGAEGEVVIDLAEVTRFELGGQKEWRRLIKSLASQVSSITLVDVGETLLSAAGDTLSLARHIAVASLLVPFECQECHRVSQESENLATMNWPIKIEDRVCTTCGGTRRSKLSMDSLAPLQKASTRPLPASAKVVESRSELLSRALTDANVAQAGVNERQTTVNDTVLGNYRIIRRLSAGGMAEVFLAKQIGFGGFEKPVAIKRIQNKLLENRHQTIELFLNEAKIAGRLTHPNIVQVLDVGEEGGALYLAMEFVHGRDLRDVVKTLQKQDAVMPLAEALYVAREVAKALHYAYWSNDMSGKRLSVVHRDVSPHNVILGYDGTVKLLDFGVAMSAITENAQSLIVGKWTYMSPETTLHGQTDHRSDLFSLGVILYLLCSGQNPFTGAEPKEIVRKIRAGDYERLNVIAPTLPAELTTLVTRMLAPNPDHRPQTGEEVVNELADVVRKYDLDSTGPRVADFLNEVFPQTGSIVTDGVQELVRQYPDDDTRSQDPTRIDRTPFSITPSARTSRRAIGVSESFKRASVSESFPPPRRSSGTLQPPRSASLTAARRQRPTAPPKISKTALVNAMIAFAILALASLAGYLIVSGY